MISHFCQSALSVIEIEAQAINQLRHKISQLFHDACELLLQCQGRIIVMGMGKSGHIAKKIAATLASTGSPAFFVHPGEACHGDLGMIKNNDVIIGISNSGKSDELLTLLPRFKQLQVPLIALTSSPNSPLAKFATIHLDIGVDTEACPLGLAPTTSTTAALVMGDAIAVALLNARQFTHDDFALSHPGGALGRKLLLCVNDLAHFGTDLPLVFENANIKDALLEVTQKKLGMACVINQDRKLVGIFTDGDIRRALNKEVDIHKTPIKNIMTKHASIIDGEALAFNALTTMKQKKITSLVILDKNNDSPIGVIHMHDILNSGII